MNEGAGYNEPGSSKFNLLDLKKGVRDHFMDGFQAFFSMNMLDIVRRVKDTSNVAGM